MSFTFSGKVNMHGNASIGDFGGRGNTKYVFTDDLNMTLNGNSHIGNIGTRTNNRSQTEAIRKEAKQLCDYLTRENLVNDRYWVTDSPTCTMFNGEVELFVTFFKEFGYILEQFTLSYPNKPYTIYCISKLDQ
jgi:hypothetical protein